MFANLQKLLTRPMHFILNLSIDQYSQMKVQTNLLTCLKFVDLRQIKSILLLVGNALLRKGISNPNKHFLSASTCF